LWLDITHDDDVSGPEFQEKDPIDIGLEGVTIDRTVDIIGATIPVRRRGSTKVVVFQCPCGGSATPADLQPGRKLEFNQNRFGSGFD
jgi:hypothetical protein